MSMEVDYWTEIESSSSNDLLNENFEFWIIKAYHQIIWELLYV